MLHPFMPFITEELWARTGEFGQKRERHADHATPGRNSAVDLVDAEAEAEIEWMVKLIAETRSTRSELNVPAGGENPAAADRRRRCHAKRGLSATRI